jgi:hypothetical protein
MKAKTAQIESFEIDKDDNDYTLCGNCEHLADVEEDGSEFYCLAFGGNLEITNRRAKRRFECAEYEFE